MLFIICFVLFQLIFQNNETINEKILELLDKNLPRGSKYSLTCYSTKKKEFVVKINSNLPLIPASTNKLFTSGIALMNLGREFNIYTEIYTSDVNLNDGILNGDLILKGHGDPTLTSFDLQALVQQLKSHKVQAITGNIIVDDTFFEETFYRNEWIEDENISVPLPPISAITVNYNTVYLKITASNKINKPGTIVAEQELDYLKIINRTKTTRTKTRLSYSSKFENGFEVITISGNIRRNSSTNIKIHISEPAYYAGHLLKEQLLENGISFWGEIRKGKLPKISNLLAAKSTPLIDLLKPINKNSNNFYSEHLFLIIGGQFARGNGSPFDASQAIITTLKTAGIYEEDFIMVDGSGISRQNQFSTEMLVKFLYHIYLRSDIFTEFYNSLSVPQYDGTLIYRFNNLFLSDRLRGKTGTLNGVTSLAGYVFSKSGDLLIFAVNFNFSKGKQYKLRDFQDRLITLIAENF